MRMNIFMSEPIVTPTPSPTRISCPAVLKQSSELPSFLAAVPDNRRCNCEPGLAWGHGLGFHVVMRSLDIESSERAIFLD